MRLQYLLTVKTNVFGVAAIALISSAATAGLSHWLQQDGADLAQRQLLPVQQKTVAKAPSTDLLVCEDGVYSPIQKTCVDQATFDDEMTRLFAALGLDAGAYATDPPQNP